MSESDEGESIQFHAEDETESSVKYNEDDESIKFNEDDESVQFQEEPSNSSFGSIPHSTTHSVKRSITPKAPVTFGSSPGILTTSNSGPLQTTPRGGGGGGGSMAASPGGGNTFTTTTTGYHPAAAVLAASQQDSQGGATKGLLSSGGQKTVSVLSPSKRQEKTAAMPSPKGSTTSSNLPPPAPTTSAATTSSAKLPVPEKRPPSATATGNPSKANDATAPLIPPFKAPLATIGLRTAVQGGQQKQQQPLSADRATTQKEANSGRSSSDQGRDNNSNNNNNRGSASIRSSTDPLKNVDRVDNTAASQEKKTIVSNVLQQRGTSMAMQLKATQKASKQGGKKAGGTTGAAAQPSASTGYAARTTTTTAQSGGGKPPVTFEEDAPIVAADEGLTADAELGEQHVSEDDAGSSPPLHSQQTQSFSPEFREQTEEGEAYKQFRSRRLSSFRGQDILDIIERREDTERYAKEKQEHRKNSSTHHKEWYEEQITHPSSFAFKYREYGDNGGDNAANTGAEEGRREGDRKGGLQFDSQSPSPRDAEHTNQKKHVALQQQQQQQQGGRDGLGVPGRGEESDSLAGTKNFPETDTDLPPKAPPPSRGSASGKSGGGRDAVFDETSWPPALAEEMAETIAIREKIEQYNRRETRALERLQKILYDEEEQLARQQATLKMMRTDDNHSIKKKEQRPGSNTRRHVSPVGRDVAVSSPTRIIPLREKNKAYSQTVPLGATGKNNNNNMPQSPGNEPKKSGRRRTPQKSRNSTSPVKTRPTALGRGPAEKPTTAVGGSGRMSLKEGEQFQQHEQQTEKAKLRSDQLFRLDGDEIVAIRRRVSNQFSVQYPNEEGQQLFFVSGKRLTPAQRGAFESTIEDVAAARAQAIEGIEDDTNHYHRINKNSHNNSEWKELTTRSAYSVPAKTTDHRTRILASSSSAAVNFGPRCGPLKDRTEWLLRRALDSRGNPIQDSADADENINVDGRKGSGGRAGGGYFNFSLDRKEDHRGADAAELGPWGKVMEVKNEENRQVGKKPPNRLPTKLRRGRTRTAIFRSAFQCLDVYRRGHLRREDLFIIYAKLRCCLSKGGHLASYEEGEEGEQEDEYRRAFGRDKNDKKDDMEDQFSTEEERRANRQFSQHRSLQLLLFKSVIPVLVNSGFQEMNFSVASRLYFDYLNGLRELDVSLAQTQTTMSGGTSPSRERALRSEGYSQLDGIDRGEALELMKVLV